MAYLIFFTTKSLQIAPGALVHGIGITQICGCFVVLPSRNGVLLNAPAVAEAVRQFKYRQNQFTLGSPAFFHTGFEGLRLDLGRVGGSRRQIFDCFGWIGFTAPTMPGSGEGLLVMILEYVAGFASDHTEEQGRRGLAPVRCPRHSDPRACGTSLWIVRALLVSVIDSPTRLIDKTHPPLHGAE